MDARILIDIATANATVCGSLSEAADELDKRFASGTRCTCKGHGICVHCLLEELNREHAVRAA